MVNSWMQSNVRGAIRLYDPNMECDETFPQKSAVRIRWFQGMQGVL